MRALSFDAHFSDLFNHTSDLIHFLDLDGTILKVNPAWLKALGKNESQVIGTSIYDFIAAQDLDRYHDYRENILHGSGVTDLEFEFKNVGKPNIIVEGQIGCVFENGTPVYTRGVFRDITAKREAEKVLHENQSRLNSFIKNAPSAVIVIDEAQSILEWNPKAEQIFGFSAAEVLGCFLADIIIPPAYRAAHKQGMAHFLATGEGPVLNRNIEVTAIQKLGHEFPISLSISAVKVDDTWLFIAFITDITPQKKLQEEAIKNEAALLQAKVEESKKDTFLSLASHELRTPLTSLKAYLQLLSRSQNTGIASSLTSKASESVVKLEALISDLLDVSKIHAEKMTFRSEEFNFGPFLRECVGTIQLYTKSHKIDITEADDVIVSGDKMRLEQVIGNLLTNAIKYSPDSKQIFVSSRLIDHYIVTFVRDYGIGIPTNNLDQIFKRFYRVDDPDMKFQGLGIGLFISKEIVERHGGKLWVESQPGNGSTFYFSVPVTTIKN